MEFYFNFKALNIVLAVKFTPFGVHYVLQGCRQIRQRCHFCNLSIFKQANDLAGTLKVAVFGLFLKMAL